LHYCSVHRGILLALLLAALPTGPTHGRTQSERGLPLHRVADVRLPGRPTRFDYQSVDPEARRLYIAHLGDSTVVTVDLDSLKPVAAIDGVAAAHGVLAVPELGRVFAAAAGTNELVTIDATTNHVLGRTPTGAFPDGVAYDIDAGLILVSNKNAGSES